LALPIRFVKQDSESVLSYAPATDALAAVLYLNEPTTTEGRAHATNWFNDSRGWHWNMEERFNLTYAATSSSAI